MAIQGSVAPLSAMTRIACYDQPDSFQALENTLACHDLPPRSARRCRGGPGRTVSVHAGRTSFRLRLPGRDRCLRIARRVLWCGCDRIGRCGKPDTNDGALAHDLTGRHALGPRRLHKVHAHDFEHRSPGHPVAQRVWNNDRRASSQPHILHRLPCEFVRLKNAPQ